MNRAYKDFEILLNKVDTEEELNALLSGLGQMNNILVELSKYKEEF